MNWLMMRLEDILVIHLFSVYFSESFILVSKMKGCVVSCCYHKKWYWNQNNWKIQIIHLDYYYDVFPKNRYPSYKLEIRLLFWLSRFQSLCLKRVSITTSSRNVL